MKTISLLVIMMVATIYAHTANYKQCMEFHKKNSDIVWKNGKCTMNTKTPSKQIEWGVYLRGSRSCIKDCAAFTDRNGNNLPLNSRSMACVYNQIPKKELVGLKDRRYIGCRLPDETACMREKWYRDLKNAEITTLEYYRIIGSQESCIYREY